MLASDMPNQRSSWRSRMTYSAASSAERKFGPVTISITPLIAIVGAGDTALLTRKKQEEFLKEWAEDFVGEEGTLEIDGVSVGTAHLLAVSPNNMTMPGRASVRMEFTTGYGS